MSADPRTIAARILEHFAVHQRPLPWRADRDPYAIWISEIMCQQTRIETVLPYFAAWMERFPTLEALAAAPLDDVLASWSGLGYYSRARNIHRCAREVASSRATLPDSVDELRALPGIGRYTAGAIASQAFGRREPVVDGNVARVLARLFALELDVKSSAGQRELWRLAGELVPEERPGDFNQGLMELGQSVCTPRSPRCERCPLADPCIARARGLQGELPILPARKKKGDKPLLARTAALICRRDALLVGKRPTSGLYAGLWEVPQADNRAALLTSMTGLELADASEMVREQELSHRRLRIEVFRGQLARKPRKALEYTELRWQPVASLAELGVSSATSAIVAAMTQGNHDL